MCTRADYWKSQDRKFCDFCKCWIADNKPSIQFHENGRKHKNNVAKKLSMLAKKSAKQAKANAKVEQQMRVMEAEAMKSYMKDMENNQDLTSQEMKAAAARAAKRSEEDEEDGRRRPERREWYEAKSREGHTYYYNLRTEESRWDAPPQGYVNLDEQRKAAKIKEKEAEAEAAMQEEELRAWRQREMMKVLRESIEEAQKKAEEKETDAKEKTEEENKTDPWNTGIEGGPRANPYGKWIPVEATKIVKPIDLQLPVQEDYVEVYVPPVEEPKPQIKEKVISSLDDDCAADEPTTFKKRKLNKSNMRQRTDDDTQD